jgi:hypothetical protein
MIGLYIIVAVLSVLVCANIVLSAYFGLRLFRSVGKVRDESVRADEISRNLQAEWDRFNRTHTEHIRETMEDLEQRARTLEDRTVGKVAELEEISASNRVQIRRLERYLREFFEVDMKNVFDSFDSTVGSVLEEMKRELLRGVDRIEDIQSMMESRDVVEGRLIEGRSAVQGLTEELAEAPGESAANPERKDSLADKSADTSAH